MKIDKPFSLNYLHTENHLMLPRVSSILLAQNLYDLLFQYVISPVEEENLKNFVSHLDQHIKSKSPTPFSIPLSDLDFLQEGLQELRLLNWLEIPVAIFSLEFKATVTGEELENIINELNTIMLCAYKNDTNLLYVYPSNLIR